MKDWQELENELLALIEGEPDLIANLANLASGLFHALPDLNWCGFYLWKEKDQELVLGPFQGRPACIRIKSGKGVCGTAHLTQTTQRVEDVHQFSGHIACDSASNSELVIPLKGLGVLDLDSPRFARFSQEEADQLERIFTGLLPKLIEGQPGS